MQQLLRINTTDSNLQLDINHAKLDLKQPPAELNLTRERGGFEMKSKPIKLKLSTFEARASVGTNVFKITKEFAQKGIQAAYDATANYAREGQMMLDIHKNKNAIPQIAKMKMNNLKEFGLAFTPKAPVEINWDPPVLDIKYNIDKLSFDWKVNRPIKSYIPGETDISIDQYSKVDIEYIGSPLYVPKSAGDNYVPLDTRA